MIILIILILLSTFSVSLFSSSITYNAYTNTMDSLSYHLPSLWVVTDVDESANPYYEVRLVKETTIDYFKNNLKHYVDKIQVGFYFFDSDTLNEDHGLYVTGARISLNAKVPFSKDFYRSTTFTLKRGQHDN